LFSEPAVLRVPPLQMWSLMGCALVRVRPTAAADDKPEMARRRHVTSGKAAPAAADGGGRVDRWTAERGATVNGKAAGSRVTPSPSTSSSHRAAAETHLGTCSRQSHNLPDQVRRKYT